MSGRYGATLYFLRHGEAGDAGAWRGNDFTRPLTAEGRERMALQADAIKRLELGLDAIVSSPLVRARETATIVADALNLRGSLVDDERLGADFGFERLAQILHAHSSARALMLVGHEPALSSVIGRLIGGAAVEMKKGSLARVDVNGERDLEGELIWLVPPRVLLLERRRRDG